VIRVRLELVSARGRQFDKTLGTANIANTGTGSRANGDYVVALWNGAHGRMRRGSVRGFPRKSRSAWELLRRALNDLHELKEIP
jgi:hypothetical protein